MASTSDVLTVAPDESLEGHLRFEYPDWTIIPPIPIPGTHYMLTGVYSIAAKQTCFYIPGLNIMLDCGCSSPYTPSHIFITHCHCDHSNGCPNAISELNGNGQINTRPNFYIPHQSAQALAEFMNAQIRFSKNNPNHTRLQSKYDITGVRIGHHIDLVLKKKQYKIEIVSCWHSVPTVGYGFVEVRKKLMESLLNPDPVMWPELATAIRAVIGQDTIPNLDDYPTLDNYGRGRIIGQLSKSEYEIYDLQEFPQFVFLGDTITDVLDDERIMKFPVIMVECSYLDDDDLPLVKKNRHVHWAYLLPYIEQYPEKTFILFHFSKKYSVNDIHDFFRDKKPDNVILWVPGPTPVSATMAELQAQLTALQALNRAPLSEQAQVDATI